MAPINRTGMSDRVVAVLDQAAHLDFIKNASKLRDKTPDEVAPSEILQTRKAFLRESLGSLVEADRAYERIIGGNELQSVNYLERGMIAARAVARINLGGGAFGTGFLIAPRVLITNNHVLPDEGIAARAIAQFHYEVGIADEEFPSVDFRLLPNELFFTLQNLDYSVVAVEPTSRDTAVPISDFGCLPLVETTGKVSEGEWLTVIQHPQGKRKAVCVRENQFIKRENDVLWYTTDTEPGSSGSPVFNNDWFVVALHHAGVPEKLNGDVQRNFDGSTKWIGNEGIRVSRIVQTLKEAHPRHPLLLPLFNVTPASARITMSPTRLRISPASAKELRMPESRVISVPIELKLQVQPDGRVESLTAAAQQGIESFSSATFLERSSKPTARFDSPFDDDYSKRKGYDPGFLGGKPAQRVGLPVLGDALEAIAAPLLKPKNGNRFVLHYHNFSVVMNKQRRLPIYSAANVSFGNRFDLSRPTDVWRRDPRILTDYQLENWYYASNKFDRGHMTRREDLEFGSTPRLALSSAADTCHWTNCTPQHERFNQNKIIWQGIERYLLEETILQDQVNAQVITGPVLDDGDPEYRKIKYPLQFWKVVAALKSDGSLFATAYLASQEEIITQFGIEVTEVPFGAYRTYQTKLSEIERVTGLRFVCGANDRRLVEVDPLEGRASARRRPRREESTSKPLPDHYHEIAEFEDIQL